MIYVNLANDSRDLVNNLFIMRSDVGAGDATASPYQSFLSQFGQIWIKFY